MAASKNRIDLRKYKKGALLLSDGSFFQGYAFGAKTTRQAEFIFHTGHSGYPEILTDPSYCRQALVFSAPQIGNQGVHEEDFESNQIWAAAAVCRDYADAPVHWKKQKSLHEFLEEFGVPGLYGVDTRRLILQLRDKGAMWGVISTESCSKAKLQRELNTEMSMQGLSLVDEVSCKQAYESQELSSDLISAPSSQSEKTCVVMDFGVKKQILRYLKDVGFSKVHVVPAHTSAEKVLSFKPDAILLSNGPGDPSEEKEIVKEVRKLHGKAPILGICLGHQLLALSLGLETRKLKFGHHAANHPVFNRQSQRVEISSQNHGFEVLEGSADCEFTHINLNDQSLEGFRHKKLPIKGIQFHPESSPGPIDSRQVFQELFQGSFS